MHDSNAFFRHMRDCKFNVWLLDLYILSKEVRLCKGTAPSRNSLAHCANAQPIIMFLASWKLTFSFHLSDLGNSLNLDRLRTSNQKMKIQPPSKRYNFRRWFLEGVQIFVMSSCMESNLNSNKLFQAFHRQSWCYCHSMQCDVDIL